MENNVNSSKVFSIIYALLSLFGALIMVLLIFSKQAFVDFRGSALFIAALVTFIVTSAATWLKWNDTFQYNYKTSYKPSKFTLFLKALFGAYAITISLFIVFNVVGLFLLGFETTDALTSQYGSMAMTISTITLFPFVRKFMK